MVGSVGGDVTVGVDPRARTDAAVRRLAEAVRHQWTAEAKILTPRAPERLRLAWASTGRPVRPAGAARDDLRGDVSVLAARFRDLPVRHLVVLGAPGSGKTVLAIRLLLDLLAPDRPGEPVPVLLPLSSWNPKTPLNVWVARRLAEDHPFLDRRMAERLVTEWRVMLLLDGLDELAPHLRALAINAIDRQLDDERPLILTCRSTEYETTVRENGGLMTRAAVVEIEPVETGDAIGYLRAAALDGDGRWNAILAHLRTAPDGPLGTALSTPLMVELLRTAYKSSGTNPAELLDADAFPSRKAIESHLIDRFIPAAYADVHRPMYDAEQAGRWLTFLARMMRRRDSRDISWWAIWSLAAELLPAVPFVLIGSGVMGSIFGPAGGVQAAFMLALVVLISRIPRHEHASVHDLALAEPMALLKHLRNRSAVWACLVAVLAGLGVGTWFGLGLGASVRKTVAYALLMAALFTIGTVTSTDWGTFLVSRWWFALTRRLPFRLVNFVQDAHGRGVLRQVGAAYQFRHALVQDRLADGVSPSTDPMDTVTVPRSILPMVRVGALVLGMITVAMVVASPPGRADLVYRSGTRPTIAAEVGCTPQVCARVEYPVWTLPPGATRTTEFSVDDPYGQFLFGALEEFPEVAGGCDGAFIEFTAVAGGTMVGRATLRSHRVFAEQTILTDRKVPDHATTLTATFERVDDSPCSAEVDWRLSAISYDHLLDVRKYLRS
ncbi:NACHT domain-containing protein [Actinomadura algeriensis]|uniref:NACHT domain-containing protein n=1 Tax=Actinomadura algeriensis TaxID=1679523 RepID=A0ABR9K4B2_9ACTN|nr:NACHT domain-containing protein [Actinomadura algeriensis]MBE1537683.1 hypothetical protein [Actinomadura algeriensis]